ncbi:MAG TPA: YbhN family protein, partial [Streptosporangiaceae bacterium]
MRWLDGITYSMDIAAHQHRWRIRSPGLTGCHVRRRFLMDTPTPPPAAHPPGSAPPGTAAPPPNAPPPNAPSRNTLPATGQPDTKRPGHRAAAATVPVRPGRHRAARVVTVIVLAGLVAGVVTGGRHTLTKSLAALGSLDFRWFAAAVLCECVSLAAFGLSRRRLLRADGHRAALGSVMAITYAGNALSMSVPFAGAQLAAIFSYRQFRRRGLDPALTGWALAVSAIASSSALAFILIVGAVAGGAPLATAAGLTGAVVFGLPAVTVALALRYPRARAVANRVLGRAIRAGRRLLRRPGVDPAALEAFLHRLGAIRLGRLRSAEVFGLAVLNWLADCACLACAIQATGVPVPWRVLLLAYGAGAAVGSTGVTP